MPTPATGEQQARPPPSAQPVDPDLQDADPVELELGRPLAEERQHLGDLLAQCLDTALTQPLVTAFREDVAQLPVVRAVDADEHPSGGQPQEWLTAVALPA
jgi:hypothetical protein